MIYCTKCNIELVSDDNCYECKSCGYQAVKVNDIVLFHPDLQQQFDDYPSEDLKKLFDIEKNHFWFKNRRSFIKSSVEKYLNPGSKIIEIGSGTAYVARSLMDNYDVAVGEIYQYGLEYAKNYGINELYQFDLMTSPFIEHFDAIGMFDVLEHIDDDVLALKNTHKMLKKNGKLFITIPPHQFLWSYHDVAARHKRRYEYRQLTELIENNGFKVLDAKGFFISILPLLFLRIILNSENKSNLLESEELPGKTLNPIINMVLDKICSLENKILMHLSLHFGGSLLVVAQKI